MTDQPTKPPIEAPSQKEMYERSIRSAAIDMAIRANCGQDYNEEGRAINSDDKIVNAASKFENFIKNGSAQPFIDGVSNHPNNPETKFKPVKKGT